MFCISCPAMSGHNIHSTDYVVLLESVSAKNHIEDHLDETLANAYEIIKCRLYSKRKT